ncbi:MAG: TIGR00289 family protein, partial [Candidatus Dadabacteria bacterium]|nr:TIGR00289 family protein [Candidatus Dadabacteria bacterium]
MEVLDEVKDWVVVVSGVFAEHLDEGWLGERIDEDAICELARLRDKYGINPSGEGGEIETTVLWAPFFRKRIVVVESEIEYQNFSGTYTIKDAKLADK